MSIGTTNGGRPPEPPVAVVTLKAHRALGVRRLEGDEYRMIPHEARHLAQHGFVRIVPTPASLFDVPRRRILHAASARCTAPAPRVVACLNIWQDRAALEQTIGTWYDHVDRVIAVDGAYASTGRPGPSTDGTIEFLRAQAKVDLLETPAGGWPDQNAKRNAYLAHLGLGDLAFVVDADEFVTGAECLRSIESCDVGWVRIESPLYTRPYGQPRLFRACDGLEYRGRHHWLYAGAELLATHQYGGLAEHTAVPVTIRNARGLGHTEERARAKRLHAAVQVAAEEALRTDIGSASDRHPGARESLRILQVTKQDAGLAVSRLHSAINATTPHSSVYFSGRDGRPFGAAAQYDLEDAPTLAAALPDADVVHCHLTLGTLPPEQLRAARAIVLHHHGSMYRQMPPFHHALAEHYRALVLVSTLELLQYGPATWLPNPMPVARYRRLRAQVENRVNSTFRVAHSPSKRALKGTETFLAVCEKLRAGGLPIEPVLIEGLPHGEALALKATCHAAFDAFFIGLQCSGLEAAAMGMPVIAGDAYAAGRYREIVGHVPYTYANDAEELEHQLVRLARDPDFHWAETERIVSYVCAWHDEAAVALRYLDLLDESFGWRRALELAPRPPQHPETPAPATPAREPVTTPAPPAPRQPRKRPARTR